MVDKKRDFHYCNIFEQGHKEGGKKNRRNRGLAGEQKERPESAMTRGTEDKLLLEQVADRLDKHGAGRKQHEIVSGAQGTLQTSPVRHFYCAHGNMISETLRPSWRWWHSIWCRKKGKSRYALMHPSENCLGLRRKGEGEQRFDTVHSFTEWP